MAQRVRQRGKMDKAASLSYLRALTPEEELELRKKAFEKIREGTLFDLGGERHFLAVKKTDDESWEVIELDEDNRRRIISGQEVRYSVLSFDQMTCLNVRVGGSREKTSDEYPLCGTDSESK